MTRGVGIKHHGQRYLAILRRFGLLVDNNYRLGKLITFCNLIIRYRPVKLITFFNLIIRLHFITFLT